MEYRPTSFRLDIRSLDDLAPLLRLVRDEFFEVRRRTTGHNRPLLCKPRLHVGRRERCVNFLVELRDDFLGSFLRRTEANPVTRLIARHKITYGRDIWQFLETRCTAHRQRPQLVSFDILHDCRHRREEDVHLAAEQIGSRRPAAPIRDMRHLYAGHHLEQLTR